MNSRNYDVYESIAHEHNARILKASNDARKLRSLSKKAKTEPKESSSNAPRPRLVRGLASLIKVFKQQPA
jgi:hypothetical protein